MKTTIPNMGQTRLGEYLPRYYDGIREMDELVRVENLLFDTLKDEMMIVLRNQFILECDVEMIALWESLLGIHFNPNIDNDEGYRFRRERLINRLVQRPPFTLRFLRERLDTIVGVGNYDLRMDEFADYTLRLESAIANQAAYNEMILTIYRMKPANIVFNLVPVLQDRVYIQARAYVSKLKYKRLGSWILGQTPFEQMGVPKRAGQWVVGTTKILEFNNAEEVPLDGR